MKLFVYGSLKKGGKYHSYLEEATLVSDHAVAQGGLYDTGMGYPAMVLSEPGEVIGEVYEIPDELWPALDDLEGYVGTEKMNLFNKLTITIEVAGEKMAAVVYVVQNQQQLKTKVPNGIWDASQSLLV